MRNWKKEKKEKEKENQRNQQGEMVDNQTANKTNKHLKKRKKKKNPQFRNSTISLLVVLSIQSSLFASPRQVCSQCLVVVGPSCGGQQLVCWWPSGPAGWRLGGVGPRSGDLQVGSGLPVLSVYHDVEKYYME
jgi:hypothetical protein